MADENKDNKELDELTKQMKDQNEKQASNQKKSVGPENDKVDLNEVDDLLDALKGGLNSQQVISKAGSTQNNPSRTEVSGSDEANEALDKAIEKIGSFINVPKTQQDLSKLEKELNELSKSLDGSRPDEPLARKTSSAQPTIDDGGKLGEILKELESRQPNTNNAYDDEFDKVIQEIKDISPNKSVGQNSSSSPSVNQTNRNQEIEALDKAIDAASNSPGKINRSVDNAGDREQIINEINQMESSRPRALSKETQQELDDLIQATSQEASIKKPIAEQLDNILGPEPVRPRGNTAPKQTISVHQFFDEQQQYRVEQEQYQEQYREEKQEKVLNALVDDLNNTFSSKGDEVVQGSQKNLINSKTTNNSVKEWLISGDEMDEVLKQYDLDGKNQELKNDPAQMFTATKSASVAKPPMPQSVSTEQHNFDQKSPQATTPSKQANSDIDLDALLKDLKDDSKILNVVEENEKKLDALIDKAEPLKLRKPYEAYKSNEIVEHTKKVQDEGKLTENNLSTAENAGAESLKKPSVKARQGEVKRLQGELRTMDDFLKRDKDQIVQEYVEDNHKGHKGMTFDNKGNVTDSYEKDLSSKDLSPVVIDKKYEELTGVVNKNKSAIQEDIKALEPSKKEIFFEKLDEIKDKLEKGFDKIDFLDIRGRNKAKDQGLTVQSIDPPAPTPKTPPNKDKGMSLNE